MFVKKMLFHTDLKKGLKVDNINLLIRYKCEQPFKRFAQEFSEARRKGDISEDYALIGETMKTAGNSSYGGTIQNKSKHKHQNVQIISDEEKR